MKYYNYEKGDYELYRCPRPACSDTGLCEFHDKEYSENNPDSVTDIFYQWVNKQISASHPICCVGFHFPRKVDFKSFQFKSSVDYAEFKDYVDFSGAKFIGNASFIGAKFNKAYFDYAKFTGKASFSDAEFQSITFFINTDFEDEIEFIGTKFASYEQGYLIENLISWKESLEYPDKFDENKIIHLRNAGLYLPSSYEKSENKKRDTQINIISSNEKESNVLLVLHKWRRKVGLKIINTKEVRKFSITKEDGKINVLAFTIL